MRIRAFEWDEQNLDHIAHRHGVSPEEVEEACYHRPYILKGKEGLYLIYGQSSDGRHLFVVCRYRGRGIIRTLPARDMTEAEKRLYQRKR